MRMICARSLSIHRAVRTCQVVHTPSDFPTTPGAFDTSFNGGTDSFGNAYGDAFVTKLNSSGSALIYSTFLGGDRYDWPLSITVDSSGCAYLAGNTYSTNFPTTVGAFDTTFSGGTDSFGSAYGDVFATKLNPSGSSLLYSTFLGGLANDHGACIAVDSLGCAYVAGYTSSSDFPTTSGAFDTKWNDSYDAFISKLSIPSVTKPLVTINAPTTQSTYSTSKMTVDIGGVTSDSSGVTNVVWSNNRGGNGTCTGTTVWTASAIALQPGQNVITVTATSSAGGAGFATITVMLTDITLPVIKITVPTTSATYTSNSSGVVLKGFATDNVGVTSPTWTNNRGGTGTCTIVNGTWTSSKIPLLPGANTLTVTEADTSGNKATANITVTFVDVTSPVIQITVPTTSATYTTNATSIVLKGFATDNVGVTPPTWTNSRGGNGTSTVANGTWTSSKIPLLPGANVLTMTETDAAGNKGTATITVTFNDVTPPVIKITVPTTAATYATTTQALTIRGFTSDNVGVTCPTWSSNRGVSGNCTIDRGTWTTSKIMLQPGANKFIITETDSAGNKATATITATYSDVTPPVIKVTVPTTAATYTTTATSVILKGFATDNVGVTAPTWSNSRGGNGSCTIVNGTWTSSKIPLLRGANPLTMTETDAAGNKAIASITVTFNDVTPPIIKITIPSSTGSYTASKASVNLAGYVSDNVGVTSVTWTNSLGGSGTCAIPSSWNANAVPLKVGANVITVTAKDAAGNTSKSAITVVW